MKKILLLLLILPLLVSCKEKIDEVIISEITLNGNEYSHTLNDGVYDIYQFNDDEIQVLYTDENTKMFFEIEEDVFIVTGVDQSFSISKNGETILTCSGDNFTCSGFESVTFIDELKIFYTVLQEKNE